MAVCDICEKDMLKADGCVEHIYLLNDKTRVVPIKAGDARDWIEPGGKCHDCGAKYGEYHHVGCDVERCSNCGGQFISCDCDYSDDILIVKESGSI